MVNQDQSVALDRCSVSTLLILWTFMLIGWSVEAGPMETHSVLRTDSYTLSVISGHPNKMVWCENEI